MRSLLPACLAWFLLISEIVVNRLRQPRAGFTIKDRRSYRMIWTVNVIAITLAFFVAGWLPHARLPLAAWLFPVGLTLFAGGLFLRWYSIFHLGRFFTVKVAIADDHRLVDSGPYRFLRHPSYSGGLAAFFGVALMLGNAVSFFLIVVPILAVYRLRIREEERALLEALGEDYRAYMNRTWRLVPLVY